MDRMGIPLAGATVPAGRRSAFATGGGTHAVRDCGWEAGLSALSVFMMIDADVGFDKSVDSGLIILVQLVDPRPGGQGQAAVHLRVWRDEKMFVFLF